MSDTARTPRRAGEVGPAGTRRRSALDRLTGLDRPPTAAAVPVPAADDDVGAEPEAPQAEPVAQQAEPVAQQAPVDDRWGAVALPAWLDPPEPDHRTGSRRTVFGEGERGAFGEPHDSDDLDEPDDPPRRRFAVAPPAAIAIILVGVVACVIAGYGLFRGSDEAPAVDFPTPGAAPATSGATPAGGSGPGTPPATPAAEVVVSVVGLVHRPGLVRLNANSRVADALAAAGGTRDGADTVSLNLAQVLRDGDQILVGYTDGQGQLTLRSAVVAAAGAPAAGPPPTGAGPHPSAAGTQTPPARGTSGSAGAAGTLVNLNTASESELDALPGVGPVTAKSIIEWRTRNGSFSSVDQLAEVDGIGPSRLAKLRSLVTV
ncbi:helix-hairpin-helix domain-containing protein [Gordonia sp. DT30]|uniref:ComEA family DNA-binding protein n=1 Tax=unclassified Gordonia (in: high G+C Gram-positive bacteria) TaxID=2657482 RepID=UPI003CEF6760